MTDTSAQPRRFMTGRKPPRPEGERFAIRWLHEYDSSVAPGAPVSYPVDVSQGITAWGMAGNGPDPTLTIVTPNGLGQPVGDCFFAGLGHDQMLAGKAITSNGIVGDYLVYEANSQGVPVGQEQDEGVVMSDALLWCHTHDDAGQPVPAGEGTVCLFAPVHPDTLGAVMAKYQRGILLGVNLTNADQQSFPLWNESASNPPNPNEGHVVLLVKLAGPIGSPTGSGGPVSWAQNVLASPQWMANCPEEWWIILTAADRAKMGEAAFDALAADLAALPGETGTAPTPPKPPPVVTPPPSPVHPNPPPMPVPPPIPPTHQGWFAELLAWLESLGFTVTQKGTP